MFFPSLEKKTLYSSIVKYMRLIIVDNSMNIRKKFIILETSLNSANRNNKISPYNPQNKHQGDIYVGFQ